MTGGHWPAGRRDVPDRRGPAWEILLVKIRPRPKRGQDTRPAGWPLLVVACVVGLFWVLASFYLVRLGPILAGLFALLSSTLRQFHGAWGRFFFFLLRPRSIFIYILYVLWLAVRMISTPGSDGAGNKIRRRSIVCRIVARQFNAAHLHVEIGPLSTSCY